MRVDTDMRRPAVGWGASGVGWGGVAGWARGHSGAAQRGHTGERGLGGGEGGVEGGGKSGTPALAGRQAVRQAGRQAAQAGNRAAGSAPCGCRGPPSHPRPPCWGGSCRLRPPPPAWPAGSERGRRSSRAGPSLRVGGGGGARAGSGWLSARAAGRWAAAEGGWPGAAGQGGGRAAVGRWWAALSGLRAGARCRRGAAQGAHLRRSSRAAVAPSCQSSASGRRGR